MSAPDLVDLLTVAQRRVARSVEGPLGRIGLSLDQWRALRACGECGGATMGDLAERVQVPAPTLTRIVDSLVDRGLVTRRPAPDDRRRVEVVVSQAGQQLLTQAESAVAGYETALRDSLGETVLADLVAALRHDGAESR